MINITDIYVIILCICHPFIDYSISGSNSQHSMLDFHKGNTVLLNNKFQGIIPTNMLAYLVNINIYVSDAYMYDIYKIMCQLHHLHFGNILFNNNMI